MTVGQGFGAGSGSVAGSVSGQYAGQPVYPGRARLRAADADREWAVEYLKGAFTDGRLSKEDYDARVGHALVAQTYADLDALVVDLSVPPAVPARTNGLAVASLACGLGQLILGPLPTIPAIVLGHVARHQIQRTGEKGDGMALAGLLLGWAGVALGVLATVGIVLLAVAVSHGISPPPSVHVRVPANP